MGDRESPRKGLRAAGQGHAHHDARAAFFAINVKLDSRPPVTRALEGDLSPTDFEGPLGSDAPHHGLPRFEHASFHAAYPLAQVRLRDPDVPLAVRLEAFNPLIPGRADESGIPAAVLRWVLTNDSDVHQRASVCFSLVNFIGTDGLHGLHGNPRQNVNLRREGAGITGVEMRSVGVPISSEQWGTIALTVLDAPDQTVTARTAWHDVTWGDALLDFWDDFSTDGELEDRPAVPPTRRQRRWPPPWTCRRTQSAPSPFCSHGTSPTASPGMACARTTM